MPVHREYNVHLSILAVYRNSGEQKTVVLLWKEEGRYSKRPARKSLHRCDLLYTRPGRCSETLIISSHNALALVGNGSVANEFQGQD